jgi:hypothetical protein
MKVTMSSGLAPKTQEDAHETAGSWAGAAGIMPGCTPKGIRIFCNGKYGDQKHRCVCFCRPWTIQPEQHSGRAARTLDSDPLNQCHGVSASSDAHQAIHTASSTSCARVATHGRHGLMDALRIRDIKGEREQTFGRRQNVLTRRAHRDEDLPIAVEKAPGGFDAEAVLCFGQVEIIAPAAPDRAD